MKLFRAALVAALGLASAAQAARYGYELSGNTSNYFIFDSDGTTFSMVDINWTEGLVTYGLGDVVSFDDTQLRLFAVGTGIDGVGGFDLSQTLFLVFDPGELLSGASFLYGADLFSSKTYTTCVNPNLLDQCVGSGRVSGRVVQGPLDPLQLPQVPLPAGLPLLLGAGAMLVALRRRLG